MEKTTSTKSSPPSTLSNLASQPAYGYRVVLAGIVAVVVIFAIAVSQLNEVGDIAAVMGAATGPIAALVGVFFGLRGATYAQLVAAGREESDGLKRDDDRRNRDEKQPGEQEGGRS